MDHIVPDVPLECLQAILRALIRAQDPEATFRSPESIVPEETQPVTIGQS